MSRLRAAKLDVTHIAEGLHPLAIPIDSVHPDPSNSRRHPERNLAAITVSLRRYGQRKPIVINRTTGNIEAGSGLWQAMKALGWPSIAGIYVTDDVATATGFAIADNRTAELAEWDETILLQHLQALAATDELANIGFDLEELRALATEHPARESFDLAAALAAMGPPRIRLGEVWQLGAHRLACGDSRDASTWDQVLGARHADLLVTSPPYNVGLRYANFKDRQDRTVYFDLIRAVGRQAIAHLAPGRYIAWNTGVTSTSAPHWHPVLLEECGFIYIREIVWVKQGIPWPMFPLTLRRKQARYYTPNWRHETIYLLEAPLGADAMIEALPIVACPACGGEGSVRGFHGAKQHDRFVLMTNGKVEIGGPIAPAKKYAHDVWHIAQQMAGSGIPTLGQRDTGFPEMNAAGKPTRHAIKAHPATYPIELPRAVMTFLSSEGEMVVDPFIGAGATIIACEEMGRVGYGIDLDPIYCELTMRRWEAATGKLAERVT